MTLTHILTGGFLLVFAANVPAQEATLPGDPFERLPESLRENLERAVPMRSDWESEVLTARVGAEVQALVRYLASPDNEAAWKPRVAPGLRVPSLRPKHELVASPAPFEVFRSAPREGEELIYEGPSALPDALRALRAGFADDAVLDTEVHVSGARVEADGSLAIEVEVIVSTDAPRPRQLNGFLELRWSFGEEGPTLVGIDGSRWEEVQGPPGAPLFRDASERAFGVGALQRAGLAQGVSYWRGRLDTRLGQPLLGHPAGIALGDVDGDGLEDLYVCQPGGLPNQLFVRRADGRFLERTHASGADYLDFSRAALLIELDGDAELDLVVTLGDELLFLAGDGEGRFAPRASLEVPSATSLAAADVDGDGDLDVYACAYSDPYGGGALPRPYHDANNGRRNVLLRNDGAWSFVDATAALGLEANNRRFSFAAAWEDYDRDGDPDLYVANDFGRNNLYRNDRSDKGAEGLRFVDVAAAAGVQDMAAGMGVSWGDVDRDGDMDLYVSNMFSSAGGRIVDKPGIRERVGEDALAPLLRFAKGNTLLENRGDGTFRDASGDAGITMGRWSWGADFLDINNDGWSDIIVPNGFVTNHMTKDL